MGLAENRYGKSRVRLVRVKRHAGHHDFREWSVEILLQGDFESCFTDGDNSKILATDTMKNTVYSLARDSSATCMEEFAQGADRLSCCGAIRRCQHAEVKNRGKAWEHLMTAESRIRRRSCSRAANGQRRKLRGRRAENSRSPRDRESGHHEDGRIGIRGIHSGFADDFAADRGPAVRHGAAGELEVRLGRGWRSRLCGRKYGKSCWQCLPRTTASRCSTRCMRWASRC